MTQLDELQQLLSTHADQIGAQIGADPQQAQSAISAALPALLVGLQRQATPGSGLEQAIEQDHDGSILDNLGGYLSGSANLPSRTTNGAGILDHIFGSQQSQVARALGSKSGLDTGMIAQLLPILAPIVMGLLGRQARTQGTSGGGLGDLASILGGLGGLGSGASIGSTGGPVGGIGDVLGGILGRGPKQ